jgi:hypothetical protein
MSHVPRFALTSSRRLVLASRRYAHQDSGPAAERASGKRTLVRSDKGKRKQVEDTGIAGPDEVRSLLPTAESSSSTAGRAASSSSGRPNGFSATSSPYSTSSDSPADRQDEQQPPHDSDSEPGAFAGSESLLSLTPFAHHRQHFESRFTDGWSGGSSSSSGSSSSAGEQGSEANLPVPSPSPGVSTQHPFDTFRFVSGLESADFPYGVAVEIMRATKGILIMEQERAANELVAKGDLENVCTTSTFSIV